MSGPSDQSPGGWGWLPGGSWDALPPVQPAPPGDARQVFSGPLSQQLFCYPQPHACQRLGLSWGCEEEEISRRGSPKLLVPWAAIPPHSSFSPASRPSPAAPSKSPTPDTLHLFSEQVPAGTRVWGTREVIRAQNRVICGGCGEERMVASVHPSQDSQNRSRSAPTRQVSGEEASLWQ